MDTIAETIEWLESGGLNDLPPELSLFQAAYRSVRTDRIDRDPKTCPTTRMLVRRFLEPLSQIRERTRNNLK